MLSILLAMTLQTTSAHAGGPKGCAALFQSRLFRMIESKIYFARLEHKLRRSRRRYGIRTLSSIESVQPGQIVLINAVNCQPCIDWSLRFNTRARRLAGWTFVAHDFKQNWISDDGQISSFLVVGTGRRVQLTFPGHGGTRTFTDARLREALALSTEAGPDLIWEVQRAQEGRWVPARTTPARDTYMQMKLE